MRAWILGAGAAVLGVVILPLQAANTDPAILFGPADRLIRAVEAGRNTTYQGVILYRGDDDVEVLQVQHRLKNGSEQERFLAQTGEERQVVRIDNRLIWVLPKDQMLTTRHPPSVNGFLAQLNAERVHLLSQWYDFRDLGQSRIAGRICSGVGVIPRDQFRYGYELCADKDTGLPLRVSLVGQRGEALEQVMFTSVSFPETISDDVFETSLDASRFNVVSKELPSLDVPLAPGQPQVSFEALPPGYRVIARDSHVLPDGQEGSVEHLLLSDGLSAVSVFSAIQQRAPEKSFHGVSHKGSLEAYGLMVGSYHITVVGEVPQPALMMIGDGVRPVLPVDGSSEPHAPNHALMTPSDGGASAPPPR